MSVHCKLLTLILLLVLEGQGKLRNIYVSVFSNYSQQMQIL